MNEDSHFGFNISDGMTMYKLTQFEATKNGLINKIYIVKDISDRHLIPKKEEQVSPQYLIKDPLSGLGLAGFDLLTHYLLDNSLPPLSILLMQYAVVENRHSCMCARTHI